MEVTLNFKSEDLKPPEFSEPYYTAATITDHTVKFHKPFLLKICNIGLSFKEKSLVNVSATDGDTNVNNAITYQLLQVPQCKFHQKFFLKNCDPARRELFLSER